MKAISATMKTPANSSNVFRGRSSWVVTASHPHSKMKKEEGGDGN